MTPSMIGGNIRASSSRRAFSLPPKVRAWPPRYSHARGPFMGSTRGQRGPGTFRAPVKFWQARPFGGPEVRGSAPASMLLRRGVRAGGRRGGLSDSRPKRSQV
jgi:hypothetical protein